MKDICRLCNIEKDITEFVKDKYTKNGYKRLCSVCNREKVKESKNKDPLKSKEKTYKWREKNREYWLSYLRYKHGNNPNFIPKEKIEKRTREEAREFLKEWKSDYDQLSKAEQVIYRENNREQLRYNSKQFRKRKKESNDIAYRMMVSLRSRLSGAIKNRARKSKSTMDLLGCELPFFIKWLEGQFEQGMSWSNYGQGNDKWQIDHNLPCSSFDFTDPEQQKECFHWSNLFPMWQKHNYVKGDSILTIDYQI